MSTTLTDSAAEIAALSRRYSSVAGRASLVRSTLARIEREIAAINEAVDAEEDGADVEFARIPTLRAECSRLAAVLAPLEATEAHAVNGLRAYGFAL